MFLKKPPEPLNTPENAKAIREAYAYTEGLRRSGVAGFVLVKLTVSKNGTVESAHTVMPPTLPLVRTKVVSIDASTGEEMPPLPPHTLQPELCRAAEAAALKLRFRPATLLGRPVRYAGYRHGFSF